MINTESKVWYKPVLQNFDISTVEEHTKGEEHKKMKKRIYCNQFNVYKERHRESRSKKEEIWDRKGRRWKGIYKKKANLSMNSKDINSDIPTEL